MKTSVFFVLSLSLSLALTIPNMAGAEQLSTSVARDSLTLIGHATTKIKTADGMVIYIDPFQPGNYSDSADIVLVTHQHGDHNQVSLVRRKPSCVVITNAESHPDTSYRSFTIGSVMITAVPAYNTNHQRAQCVGYVLEFNGVKLYHAGDTGVIPEMANLAARQLTYCMLPIDGIFTMSPEDATQAAITINAAFNIPMHTMPTPDTFSLPLVARFTPPNKVVIRNGETISLQVITAVDPVLPKPMQFELMQNYPNPFNPSTQIAFAIPVSGPTTLKVFDALGREVATLVDEELPAGIHEKKLNAEGLAGGIYFYTLRWGNFSATRKLTVIK